MTQEQYQWLKDNGYDPAVYDVDEQGNIFENPVSAPATQKKMSRLRAAGTSFLGNLLPSAAGLVAGAKAGALGGSLAGLPGTIIGGIGGGLVGGYGAGKLQEAALESFAPEAIAEMQRAQTDQPVASYLGGFAPNALALRPSFGGIKGLTAPLMSMERDAMRAAFTPAALNVGANVAGSTAAQLVDMSQGGEFSAPRFAADVALGSLFSNPTRIGRSLGLQPLTPEVAAPERLDLAGRRRELAAAEAARADEAASARATELLRTEETPAASLDEIVDPRAANIEKNRVAIEGVLKRMAKETPPEDLVQDLANDPFVGNLRDDPAALQEFIFNKADKYLQQAFARGELAPEFTGQLMGVGWERAMAFTPEGGVRVAEQGAPDIAQAKQELADARAIADDLVAKLQRAGGEGQITQADLDAAAQLAARRGLKLQFTTPEQQAQGIRGAYLTNEAGERVIYIDANAATPDTAIHEIGHDVFVRSAGERMKRSLMQTAEDSPAFKAEYEARLAEGKPEAQARDLALEEGVIQAFGERYPNVPQGEIRSWFNALKASLKSMVGMKLSPEDAARWLHYATTEAVPWKGVAVGKTGEERMQRGRNADIEGISDPVRYWTPIELTPSERAFFASLGKADMSEAFGFPPSERLFNPRDYIQTVDGVTYVRPSSVEALRNYVHDITAFDRTEKLPPSFYNREFVSRLDAAKNPYENVRYQRAQQETPEFKNWFGESQVVDADGKPLVVYHGTSKDVDFTSFKGNKNGIWFTPDPDTASNYAMQNDSMGYRRGVGYSMEPTNTASRVIPAYVSIKNPAVFDVWPDVIRYATNYKKALGDYFTQLKAQGHDGVIFGSGKEKTYVAFNPEQVKSATANKGTFSPESKDIRYQRGQVDDAAYLKAVESGDTKTAQQMVDEAAKAAGYDTTPRWHGTGMPSREFAGFTSRGGIPFTEFRPSKSGVLGPGIYTTTNIDDARLWAGTAQHEGRGNASVIGLYINPSDSQTSRSGREPFDPNAQWAVTGSPGSVKSSAPITYDSSGNVIPLSKRFQADSPDIRYQRGLGSDDAAYLKAVEAGDMETAQRMVDEAAKAAGYTIGPVYHGTDSNTFTVFDRNAPFSDKTVNAASPTSAMNRSRLGFWFSTKPEEAALYGKNILKAWLKGGQVEAMPVSKWARGVPSADSDSIYVEGDMPYTTDQWVVKQPSQIKSADPITRDSNGNVIPLSQRFQTESSDIRYQRSLGSKIKTPSELDYLVSKGGPFAEVGTTIKAAANTRDYKQGQWSSKYSLTTKLPEEARVRLLNHLAGEFDSGVLKAPAPDLKAAYDQLRNEYLPAIVNDYNTAGFMVRDTAGLRARGSNPTYFPLHAIADEVKNVLTTKQGSPEWDKLKADFINWNTQLRQADGASLAEAQRYANEKFDEKLSITAKPPGIESGIPFSGARKPEGYPLPPSWRSNDILDILNNYTRRSATDFAYQQHVESSPVAMAALGAKTMLNNQPIPANILQSTAPVINDPSVQSVLREYRGTPAQRTEGALQSIGRFVSAATLGPVSKTGDIGTSMFKGLAYLPGSEYAEGLATFTNKIADWAALKERSYASGLNKRDAAENMRQVLGIAEDSTAFMDKAARVLSKVTFVNDLESVARVIAQGWGETVIGINKKLALGGDKNATQMLDTLTPDWRTRTDVDLAAQVGRLLQGSYDMRQLPASFLEGAAAPYLTWSKWSMGQYDSFMKYALRPAMQGNMKPLIGQMVIGLLGGGAISAVQEWLNNREGKDITWRELESWMQQNQGELGADGGLLLGQKLLTMAQKMGTFGFAGDLSKMVVDAMAGGTSQGVATMPAMDAIYDTTKRAAAALKALDDGEDFGLVAKALAQDSLTGHVQVLRVVRNWFDTDENLRYDDRRRQRLYDALSGLPSKGGAFSVNYSNLSEREFERGEIGEDTGEEALALVERARKEATSREDYASRIRKLKTSQNQIMPSLDRQPMKAARYLSWLEGAEEGAGAETMRRYMVRKGEDEYRKSLIEGLSGLR